MEQTVHNGLEHKGVLPGGLNLPGKAAQYCATSTHYSGPIGKRAGVYAYALEVSEENASGAKIVTAPTCGSCGVLPAVLTYLKEVYKISEVKILRALATAGLIGSPV